MHWERWRASWDDFMGISLTWWDNVPFGMAHIQQESLYDYSNLLSGC